MNIISSSQIKKMHILMLLLSVCMLIVSCLQGPWEYTPKNILEHKGLWINAYMIAGLPVKDFCVEKQIGLNEESTQAFKFYTSASVVITGDFSNGSTTQTLSENPNRPNCFVADTSALPMRGKDYDLRATFVWDSAGQEVTSIITGTAHLPYSFEIDDSALAPALAATGTTQGAGNDSLGSLLLQVGIPIPAQKEIIDKYGIGIFTQPPDSIQHFFEKNGIEIQKIISKYRIKYSQNDSVFYLTNDNNTKSHYYNTNADSGVGSVLITIHYDSNALRPENRFDRIAGMSPELENVYMPGTQNRLLIWADIKGKNYRIFDSLAVVNTYFLIGKNTLRFFGMEKAYEKFMTSVTDNADDPRLKIVSNVSGAKGFFTGGILDSFTVYIKADSSVKLYNNKEAHAAYCTKEGWDSQKDCREFYPIYCSQKTDTIACTRFYMLDSLKKSLPLPTAGNRTDSVWATQQLCIEGFATADSSSCSMFKLSCQEHQPTTTCQSQWFNYCLDHNWQGDLCKEALVWYCVEKPGRSTTLCEEASKLCLKNLGWTACTFLEDN